MDMSCKLASSKTCTIFQMVHSGSFMALAIPFAAIIFFSFMIAPLASLAVERQLTPLLLELCSLVGIFSRSIYTEVFIPMWTLELPCRTWTALSTGLGPEHECSLWPNQLVRCFLSRYRQSSLLQLRGRSEVPGSLPLPKTCNTQFHALSLPPAELKD